MEKINMKMRNIVDQWSDGEITVNDAVRRLYALIDVLDIELPLKRRLVRSFLDDAFAGVTCGAIMKYDRELQNEE